MSTTFFDEPKKFFSDTWKEAWPNALTFLGFPFFLLGDEKLRAKVGATDIWQSLPIQAVLFPLYAFVIHIVIRLIKGSFGSTSEGYTKLPTEKSGDVPGAEGEGQVNNTAGTH